MKYTAAPGCVLIEPIVEDSMIASTDRNYERKGRVTARATNVDIEIDDIIFFDEYSYRRFEHEGKELYVVNVTGDGLWLIAKQDATNTHTSEMQKEWIPPSVSSDEAIQ